MRRMSRRGTGCRQMGKECGWCSCYSPDGCYWLSSCCSSRGTPLERMTRDSTSHVRQSTRECFPKESVKVSLNVESRVHESESLSKRKEAPPQSAESESAAVPSLFRGQKGRLVGCTCRRTDSTVRWGRCSTSQKACSRVYHSAGSPYAYILNPP
jgi:hypothetical protein